MCYIILYYIILYYIVCTVTKVLRECILGNTQHLIHKNITGNLSFLLLFIFSTVSAKRFFLFFICFHCAFVVQRIVCCCWCFQTLMKKKMKNVEKEGKKEEVKKMNEKSEMKC